LFDQVQHRQAVDDDEVLAHALARAANDFQRQADAVLVTAPPFIAALVGALDDELVDEITLGAHDLDPVIAGLGPARRSGRNR
jgi:hypothetical protein